MHPRQGPAPEPAGLVPLLPLPTGLSPHDETAARARAGGGRPDNPRGHPLAAVSSTTTKRLLPRLHTRNSVSRPAGWAVNRTASEASATG